MDDYFESNLTIKNNQLINNSICRYLDSYNDKLRLLNYDLDIKENIFRIKKSFSKKLNPINPTTKECSNNIIPRIESHSESRQFFPKLNNIKPFLDQKIFNSYQTQKKRKLKLLPINEFISSSSKIKSKNKIIPFPSNIKTNIDGINDMKKKIDYKNEFKVKKIVDSLLNEKNIYKTRINSKLKRLQILKEKFPIKDTVDPKKCIKFNLLKSPNEKKLFLSYDLQLKCINNNEDSRKMILKQVELNNLSRFNTENLQPISFKDNNYNSLIIK